MWGTKPGVATLSKTGVLRSVTILNDSLSYSAAVGNLDGVGISEIVGLSMIPGDAARKFTLYRFDSTWQEYQDLQPSPYPFVPQLIDLNDDGLLDLSSSGVDGTVDVLLNLGAGLFPDPPTLSEDYTRMDAADFGDLNGDLRPDIAIAYQGAAGFYIDTYLNRPDGLPILVDQVENLSGSPSIGDILIAPVVGTAPADLLVQVGNGLYSYEGMGDGILAAGVNYLGFSGSNLIVADVTGDRTPELLTSATGVTVYEKDDSFFSTTPLFSEGILAPGGGRGLGWERRHRSRWSFDLDSLARSWQLCAR